MDKGGMEYVTGITVLLCPNPKCKSDELNCEGHFVECCDCGFKGPDSYPVPDVVKVINLWNEPLR